MTIQNPGISSFDIRHSIFNSHTFPSKDSSKTFEVPLPARCCPGRRTLFLKFLLANIPVQRNFLRCCASICNPFHSPGFSSVALERCERGEVLKDLRVL